MKKRISIAVSVVALALLLIAGTVAVTVAYLTSATQTVTNTFTVGSITITMDETDVDVYGVKDSDNRVVANTYKLIPGHTYVKDPTVHVTKGSEKCYLFVKVVDNIAAIQDTTTVVAQMTTNGWTELNGVDNVWYKVVDAREAADDVDVVVFENFKIKGDADVSAYADKTIEVTAYAIQYDGFADAAAAWTAAPADWKN